MTLIGIVQDGVVVFPSGVAPPEGARVTVVVAVEPDGTAKAGTAPESDREQLLRIMDRIAALPIEGSSDPCSARNHDQVLYGAP